MSSPDSGCDMIVTYTKEPRVRKPGLSETGSDTDCGDSVLKPSVPTQAPVPAPRESIRKNKSESRKSSLKPKTVQVTNIEHPPSLLVKPPGLESAYSRAGIYSLEGSRLNCIQDQAGSEAGETVEMSDSGRGSSLTSQDTVTSSVPQLRSYASSKDILEMYGRTLPSNNNPLTPRMVGFSSTDLRLPPAAMLMSLSGLLIMKLHTSAYLLMVYYVYAGKKSNSSLSIHWGQTQTSVTSPYQNVPPPSKKRITRDTVF